MAVRSKTGTLCRLGPQRNLNTDKHIRLAIDLGQAGRYYRAAKHRDAAKQSIELDLQNSPEDPLVLNDCAAALADLDELDAATDLLKRARAQAPWNAQVLLNLSTVLWRRGHLREAARLVAEAHDLAPEDSDIRDLRRRIRGTLSVFDKQVLLLASPAVDRVKPRPPPPGTGRIRALHVLWKSLPFKQSGYSFRSQEILLGQMAIGMDPVAVTEPFFPQDCHYGTYDMVEEIEGVVYHRLRGPVGLEAHPPASSTFESEGHRAEIRGPLDEHLAYYARELFGLASRIQPCLLHSHTNHRNALAAGAAAGALGIPHVYEVRGMWEESAVSRGVFDRDADRYRLERNTETRCCREADAVITLSETMRDDLVSRGVHEQKIFLVPNGANPDRFPVVEYRSERLARELGFGSGPVIGYVGSLSAYEGVSDLLRGFRLVLDVIPEARALIIGGGRDVELAHATAAELELGENVIFAGQVDRAELLDYYSLIDIFVVPRPPFRVCELVTPLKPYEAMATGRAVVVSDVAALREMIIEGQTAVSFRAGRPESLAAVCVELCKNSGRRRELGANAARWVRENRSWKAVAAGYLDAYNFAFRAYDRRHAMVSR